MRVLWLLFVASPAFGQETRTKVEILTGLDGRPVYVTRAVPCEVQAHIPKAALREEAPAETTAQRLARLRAVPVTINWNGQPIRQGTLGEYIDLGGSLDAYRPNGAVSAADLSFLRWVYQGVGAVAAAPLAQPMPTVIYSTPAYRAPAYYGGPFGGACLLPGR